MFKFFEPLQKCFNAQSGCGWKDVEPFISGILGNLIVIGMFVGAWMVVYAGFVLLKGKGDAGARSKARNIFINVIIGCIILFSAYFIVDLIFTKLLVDKSLLQTF